MWVRIPLDFDLSYNGSTPHFLIGENVCEAKIPLGETFFVKMRIVGYRRDSMHHRYPQVIATAMNGDGEISFSWDGARVIGAEPAEKIKPNPITVKPDGKRLALQITDGFYGFTQSLSPEDARHMAAQMHRFADEAERN